MTVAIARVRVPIHATCAASSSSGAQSQEPHLAKNNHFLPICRDFQDGTFTSFLCGQHYLSFSCFDCLPSSVEVETLSRSRRRTKRSRRNTPLDPSWID